MKKIAFGHKVKEYVILWKASLTSFEYLGSLKARHNSLFQTLFIDRLQSTTGFFKTKVADFIEPNDWGKKDPCNVTMFRNGYEDPLNDEIVNLGKEEDVKTFCCPNFQEGTKCTQDCKYSQKYNEYLELNNKIIPEIEKQHEALVKKRKAVWQRMFNGKTK